MINAFRMNLGVKSFFLFFFFCEYNRDSWSMLMDQVRKQFFRVFELLLSFFFLLEIVILFPVFSFIVDKSDILFYMANFFFQFCENSFIFGIVY